MFRKTIAFLVYLGLLLSFGVGVRAAETGGSFVLTAVTANSVIIEPVRVTYTAGQTISEALQASGHTFEEIEQGFVYAIEGVTANFTIFYDEGGYALDAPAQEITAICFGVTSQYSADLLGLIREMAAFRVMDNHVQAYGPAAEAYANALDGIRNADAATAATLHKALADAIEAYEKLLSGQKYTVTIQVTQGGSTVSNLTTTLTDSYGNVTTTQGSTARVIAGTYSFCVSDGGYSRTEGTITVSGNTILKTTLPTGEWFGAVRLLDAAKEPYPYTQNTATHSAAYAIVDTAGPLSSVYLNVEQGDVPDAATTRLRAIYVGTDGENRSDTSRSWESTATALTYLLERNMTGRVFDLEAQYTDSQGHKQIQSYTMTITRVPTLRSLTVSSDGTTLPLTFSPTQHEYALTTVSDTLDITALPFGEDYTVTGSGKVSIPGSSKTVTIQVKAPEGQTNTYTLKVTKVAFAAVTLTVPSGTTAQVINAAGAVIAPVSRVYHLIPGETYTCIATRNTHFHTTMEFVASAGLNVQVKAPDTTDWLTGLALFNGNSVSSRLEYESDTPFSPNCHSYTYSVSDCNTTAYMQATASGYTVTARYTTQTTSALTHGIEKAVTVSRTVSDTGSAQILAQCVAKSGNSQTVTVRISKVSGNVTYYQDYSLTLARKLHLSEMAVSLPDETLTFLDTTGANCEFDRDVTAYTVRVDRDTPALYVDGAFPNVSDATSCCGGYYALVNGTRYDTPHALELPLDTQKDQETVTIQVCHEDNTSIATTYTLTVEKTDPVNVTIDTTPSDAVVFLVNSLSGKRVLGKDGVYALTPGCSYSYTVTCTGYVGIHVENYTAPTTDGTLTIPMEKAAPSKGLTALDSTWPSFRADRNNNGVINARTPTTDEDAVLYWATKIGDGYDKNACGCPIIVDGYLYTYAGSALYKVDTVSGEIVATGQMDRASSFAINPPTYADGMIFVGLADGTVQAFNASTLESLWLYTDALGGQPNCPIVYHEGYIYTGFWVGETSQANYVCLSATDEDPEETKEQKLPTWHYTTGGGFYWAGAYVCDDFLLIGTDDGEAGYTEGHARLLSFNTRSGQLLDEITMPVVGDIRSSITYNNGKFYFTNKGGYFFEMTVNTDGTFPENGLRTLPLTNDANNSATPAMSTCTPTLYNGRAYVGVSGISQFGAYSGHNITVIDLQNWEIAYTIRTQGYPQTSGVLTTAYEETTGKVYVYFFDNYTPGKLRVLEDRPGQTKPSLTSTEVHTDKGQTTTYTTAYALFTPVGDQAQYAICSPIVDEYGTIYFKNDSAYLMALGSAVEKLEITQAPDKLTYKAGETFDPTGMVVTARYTGGLSRDVTDYVTWSDQPLAATDTDFIIVFPHVMYQNLEGQTGVDVIEPFAPISLTIEGESVTCGDVNGDSRVNASDAALVYRYTNGKYQLSSSQLTAADVNGDGKVGVTDAALIYRYTNGKITKFPIENNWIILAVMPSRQRFGGSVWLRRMGGNAHETTAADGSAPGSGPPLGLQLRQCNRSP